MPLHWTTDRSVEQMKVPQTWVEMLSPESKPSGFVSVEGFRIKLPAEDTPEDAHIVPLVCFINPKSGGQSGEVLMTKLIEELTCFQVFDITKGGPGVGLEKFIRQGPEGREFARIRVLACGGDGTVGWVLSILDGIEAHNKPPVAVLPLGTGNDMSRTLGWGTGFDRSDSIPKHLAKVKEGEVVMLDRWKITVHSTKEGGESGEEDRTAVMNNYFSVGVDASISLGFHEQREEHPEKFKSRFGNKVHYARLGSNAALSPQALGDRIRVLTPEGARKSMKPSWEGVIIVNLPSYQAGNNFWGTPAPRKNLTPVCIGDHKMEVMAAENAVKLGLLQSGAGHAPRIAQTSEATIEISEGESLAMQVDGEPWLQECPCTVTVTFLGQSPMLKRNHVNPLHELLNSFSNGEGAARAG